MKLRRKAFFSDGIKIQNLTATISNAKAGTTDIRQLAISAGWDGTSQLKFQLTITSSGSLTGNPALVHSAVYPAGSTITLRVDGLIAGTGGDGGSGGVGSSQAGLPGNQGGTAMLIRSPITVHNYGTIAGGGGGGGGGAGIVVKYSAASTATGTSVGTSGSRGATAPGSASASNTPSADIFFDLTAQKNYSAVGGKGGNGGSAGAAGASGAQGTTTFTVVGHGSPGAGAPAGCYVDGNAYVAWQATGTRLGSTK